MKKQLLLLFTLLFAVMGAWAETINVPGDHLTIQAAVNAASEGDIIQIAAGTYTEALTIGKSLTFIGAGPSSTTITSSASPIIQLSVTGKSFAFQDLTIYGNVTNIGIRAGSAISINSFTLQNVIAENCKVAVYLSEGETVVVNTLYFDNLTLRDNTHIGAYIGRSVAAGTVTNSSIYNNGFSDADATAWQKCGIQFIDFYGNTVPQVTVTNSTFDNNGAGASSIERTGLVYYTAANTDLGSDLMTVSGCTFTNHLQFAVRIRNGNNVGNTATVNGTFSNNWLDIWFSNITGTTSSTTLVRNTVDNIRTVGPGPTYWYNTIQAAVNAANAGNIVLVADGTYNENVTINKNISLLSVNGADVTIIDGVNSGGELGTILLTAGRNGVTIGNTGNGFTIKGIDGAPGLEKAAIYLQGAQTNITIEGNIIEARGDAGLMAEYNAADNTIVINNNQFTGQTFIGDNPAGVGFGAQFTLPNVPRQLVVFGGGAGTTNTQNISFTNNIISGIAGGMSITADDGSPIPPTAQGNTMVTLDLAGTNTITGNTFSGTTTRYAEALRVRGAGTYAISGNNFNGSYPVNMTAGTTVAATGIARIADAWVNNTFSKGVTVMDNTLAVKINSIQTYVQAGISLASPGDVVTIKPGTYTEQLYINKEGLVVDGAGKANTFIKSPPILSLSFATPGVRKPVVFIENVAACTLSNLTVDGDGKGNANNAFIGVGFWNAGGTVSNVDVLRIIDTPFSGAQHGVGVYSYNNTGGPYTINCSNMIIDDYQKNGMAMSGNGLTVNLDNVSTLGAGPTTVTAQNGIQVGYGAIGTINNCTVTGNIYTGDGWAASGFLMYQGGSITMTNITATNNYTGVYIEDFSGSINGGTITNSDPHSWDGLYVRNIVAAPRSGEADKYEPSPLAEDYIPAIGERSARNFNLSNLTVTGHAKTDSWGVYFRSNADLLTGSMTGCTVTGWDWGVYTREAGGTVAVVASENKIIGNTTWGFYSNTLLAQNAEKNWWGHASGPKDVSDDTGTGGLYNPLGEGDNVSDYVDYDPWYADVTMTIEATTEVTNVFNEDQGVYYNSIQDAILAADVGDVIEVTGTHNVKNIVVNKGLKIAAAAGGAKFNGLDGSRSGTGFTINTTEPVIFEDVEFLNYDLAIDFIAFGSASITDCKFTNCVAAVDNHTSVDINAEYNYWGHASGPKDDSPVGLYNPYGQGASVTDYVDYQPWFANENLNVMPVDISVVNNACGHLQVIVKPNSDMSGQLTTALFAVKWVNASYPDPAVLTNFTSLYNIDFQYYETSGTSRYAVFGLQTNALVAWTAGIEYVLVEFDFQQNQPEGTVSDFEIANDAWAYAENALYYMEYWGSDYTGYIYGFADDVYLGSCDLQLHLKAMLQGPYNATTNLMNQDLRNNNLIPTVQPFNTLPWSYAGTESLTSVPGDMVDWVLVELRSVADGAPIVRKAALLFKDGTVRSHIDSFFDVYFTGDFMPNSDYYVVVTARSHMPVMSAALVNIPNANDRYDFSNMTTYPSYGGATAQVLLETGVHGMISGDVNKDGKLIYSGTNNDRDPILAKIVTVTGYPYINGVIQGYYQEDLTMNSWVKYSGSGNDQRLIILNLIELTGTYNLNAQYNTVVPGTVVKSGYLNAGTGPVDIALVENVNSLDVVLLTRTDFEYSYVTNIQFTLSWDANNPMMDAITGSFVSDYKLEPQGSATEYNGRIYMTYVMVEAVNLPSAFNTGDQVTVLSFDKGSWAGTTSKSSLANNDFTLQTNGDYYISVIGLDQTGRVLDVATGIDNPSALENSLNLYPNPVTGTYVNMSFIPVYDETINVTVMDISSRIVSTQQIEVKKGLPVVKQIALSGLAKGIYYIRLQGNQTIKSGKLEIQ